MKAVIIFASKHHGNTRKIVQAIKANFDIDIIDAAITQRLDLSKYDLICFASGIAYGNYYPEIESFIDNNLLPNKNVILIHTAGNPSIKQSDWIIAKIEEKNSKYLATWCSKGFDTFGPFKLIGGISKGHPNENEINKAIEFFDYYLKATSKKS